MDPAVLVPILLAILGGGGVAWYTARPRKDSIIAEASERAVVVVTKAIERLEQELKAALERIDVLEAELRKTSEATAIALRVSSEAAAVALRVSSEATAEALRVTTEARNTFEDRIAQLTREVEKLGGHVEPANRRRGERPADG